MKFYLTLNILLKLISTDRTFQAQRTLLEINHIILMMSHKWPHFLFVLKYSKHIIPSPKISVNICSKFFPFILSFLRNYQFNKVTKLNHIPKWLFKSLIVHFVEEVCYFLFVFLNRDFFEFTIFKIQIAEVYMWVPQMLRF